MNRRQFLAGTALGAAGLTLGGGLLGELFAAGKTARKAEMVDKVALGKTGLRVSRLAMGTGSIGGGGASNQTRLGTEEFVKLFRHGFDRGVRFYDMAESYGSMPFVGAAIRDLPRHELALLSKIWTYDDDDERRQNVGETIRGYLKTLGTDHLDVLLLHCMTSADWNKTRTYYMEALDRAKEQGLIRAVGVSCHDRGALDTASTEPWVDVIMARINPYGARMDGSPEQIVPIIEAAREHGKGVVGMKIFGEGTRVAEHEREESIRWNLRQSGIHAMTIGFESIAQLDDAIEKVIRLSR